MVLGSWDQRWTNWAVGDLFGLYLTAGVSVAEAWNRADREGMPQNDTAVGSMGIDANDCWSRINNMTLYNMGAFPRRRDDEVRHYCRRTWSPDGLRG